MDRLVGQDRIGRCLSPWLKIDRFSGSPELGNRIWGKGARPKRPAKIAGRDR